MIIDNTDIWMISLLDNPEATFIREMAVEAWKSQGFQVNLFNAITPDTIKNVEPKLNFGKKHRLLKPDIVDFTESEKAAWYSHFLLWKKSFESNKPFIILEEDVIPIKKIPKKWKIQNLILLAENSSCCAYIITPKKAKFMYEDIQTRIIKTLPDGYIDANNSHLQTLYYRPSDQQGYFIAQLERKNKSVNHKK
jgi:hypothetical protein